MWGWHEGDLKVHGSESSTQELPREGLLPMWRAGAAGGQGGWGQVGNQPCLDQSWKGVGHPLAEEPRGTDPVWPGQEGGPEAQPGLCGEGSAQRVWSLLAALIFIALGGIKLFLIYNKKAIPEERSEIDFKKTCGIAASTGIYTLFAGFACGLLMLSGVKTGIAVCIMTIAIVIVGVYVGYRNGELDKRIYWSGGIFLIVAGSIVVMQYIGGCIVR